VSASKAVAGGMERRPGQGRKTTGRRTIKYCFFVQYQRCFGLSRETCKPDRPAPVHTVFLIANGCKRRKPQPERSRSGFAPSRVGFFSNPHPSSHPENGVDKRWRAEGFLHR
jgi:hypothetical protein